MKQRRDDSAEELELEGGSSESENVTERDEKSPSFFLPDSRVRQHEPREIPDEHQD